MHLVIFGTGRSCHTLCASILQVDQARCLPGPSAADLNCGPFGLVKSIILHPR